MPARNGVSVGPTWVLPKPLLAGSEPRLVLCELDAALITHGPGSPPDAAVSTKITWLSHTDVKTDIFSPPSVIAGSSNVRRSGVGSPTPSCLQIRSINRTRGSAQ